MCTMQRIVGGAVPSREQTFDRSAVERVRAESIDCLRRERDQPAVAQAFGGARNQLAIGIVGIDP
jgi:hypothetical protein